MIKGSTFKKFFFSLFIKQHNKNGMNGKLVLRFKDTHKDGTVRSLVQKQSRRTFAAARLHTWTPLKRHHCSTKNAFLWPEEMKKSCFCSLHSRKIHNTRALWEKRLGRCADKVAEWRVIKPINGNEVAHWCLVTRRGERKKEAEFVCQL